MGRRVVCVDVDNTLADYTGALRRYVRSVAPVWPCPDPVSYAMWESDGWPFTGSPDGFAQWHARAVAAGLYLREQPMEGAKTALERLRADGWLVVVATSRPDDGRNHTGRWLEAHGIPADGLYVGGDKLHVPCDVLVDDDPAVLARARAAGVRVLHPNHEYCAHAPGVGFDSWADVPRLVEGE